MHNLKRVFPPPLPAGFLSFFFFPLEKGETGGFTFVFVVNIQLPRTFTKKSWAASVVLYWGIPEEALAGKDSRM